MIELYRYACPEGHRSLTEHTESVRANNPSPTYWCKTCEETYDGHPIDLKRESLPTEAR